MITAFALLLISIVFNADQAESEPCGLSDPQLNECLGKMAQKLVPRAAEGIRELGLEPMDPFTVPDHDGVPDSGFTYAYSGAKINGFGGIVVDSIKLNYEKRILIISITFNPKITVNFRYKGSFLASAVHGKAVVNTINSHNMFKIYFTVVTKNGKDYWRVIKHKVSYSLEKIIHDMRIDDPTLGPFGVWMSNFMNNHYKELHNEVEAPMTIALTNKLVDYIDMVFAAVPLDKIFKP